MSASRPLGEMLPRIGSSVERYRVLAELAHGGMAAIYVVRRSGIGGFDRLLALKVLLPHLRNDRKFVDMFLDEARIASFIQHPNVVQVFDVGEHDGAPYLVMELLRGQPLSAIARKARERGEAIPLPILAGVLCAVCRGLHAAHETNDGEGHPLGIVHRDVSPHNVHVGYDGTVKVVDFGVASARGRITSTRSGEVKGKLGFLAPEQVTRAHPVDRRVDLWALGVVAWELLAGRRLFRDGDDATTMWNIVHGEIPSLGEVAPEVPESVAGLVMDCLERDPWRRPQTADIVAQRWAASVSSIAGSVEIGAHVCALFDGERSAEDERLSAAQRDAPPAVAAPGRPRGEDETRASAPGRSRRSWLFWLAAAAAIVALAGVVTLSWRSLETGTDRAGTAPPIDRAPTRYRSEPRTAVTSSPAPRAPLGAPTAPEEPRPNVTDAVPVSAPLDRSEASHREPRGHGRDSRGARSGSSRRLVGNPY